MLTPHEAAGAGLRHRRAELHREDLILEVIKANMAHSIDSDPVRWLERSAPHRLHVHPTPIEDPCDDYVPTPYPG